MAVSTMLRYKQLKGKFCNRNARTDEANVEAPRRLTPFHVRMEPLDERV